MELEWIKCRGGEWCELNRLDLSHKNLKNIDGVFILWYGKDDRTILRTGNGRIATLLLENREDIAIQAFSKYGLYVTWALVPMFKRKGVEIYLSKTLNPKIKDDLPKGRPVKVNLPWDEVKSE